LPVLAEQHAHSLALRRIALRLEHQLRQRGVHSLAFLPPWLTTAALSPMGMIAGFFHRMAREHVADPDTGWFQPVRLTSHSPMEPAP